MPVSQVVVRVDWQARAVNAAYFSTTAKKKSLKDVMSQFDQQLDSLEQHKQQLGGADKLGTLGSLTPMLDKLDAALNNISGGKAALQDLMTQGFKSMMEDPEYKKLDTLDKNSKEHKELVSKLFNKHMMKMMTSDLVSELGQQLAPELDKALGVPAELSAQLNTEYSAISAEDILKFQDLLKQQQPMQTRQPVSQPAAPQPVPTTEEEPITEEELNRILKLDADQNKYKRKTEVLAQAQQSLKSMIEAMQQNDFDTAISDGDSVIRALDEIDDVLALPMVYPLMYESYLKAERVKEAKSLMDKALKTFGAKLEAATRDFTKAFSQPGTSSSEVTDEQMQALRARHNVIKIASAVAVALQQQHRHDAAVDFWRLIRSNSPDLASTYLPLVDCLIHIRQNIVKKGQNMTDEEKRTVLTLSSELDQIIAEGQNRFPDEPEIIVAAARVCIWRGELDNTVDLYVKLAKHDLATAVRYLNRMAINLLAKKDDEKAEKIARQVLQLTNNADKEAHGMIARVLKNRHQYVEAIDHMERAAEGDAKLLTALGVSLALEPPHPKLKDIPRAKKALTQAVALEPEYVDGWLTLAAVHAQLREWQEAVDTLDKFLQIQPNHAQAAKARTLFASKLKSTSASTSADA